MVWDGKGWYGMVRDGMDSGAYEYGMVLDGWGIVWNDMRWYEMSFDGMGWHEMV